MLPHVSSFKRIAWILDAHQTLDAASAEKALSRLWELLDHQECVIEPVRVVEGERSRSVSPDCFRKHRLKLVHEGTENPENCGEFYLLPMRIFRWGQLSDKELSHYISCYTQLSHTDLLIASDGLKRKLLQAFRLNFLNTLSYQSKVPVMLLNSEAREAGEFPFIRNILFPIIDPAKSEESFFNLMSMSQLSHAKITILFRFYDGARTGLWTQPVQYFGQVPFFDPKAMLQANTKLKMLSDWVNLGRSEGIEIALIVDKGCRTLLEAVVESRLREKFDLIALDPSYLQSNQLDAELSELTRKTRCPVWISHPIGQSGYVGEFERTHTELIS